MAPPKKGSGKQKAKTQPAAPGNMFTAIEGMDGNPASPEEFDASPHDDDEMYFRADDEATDVEKRKVKALNFIHKELHYDTVRNVPALVIPSEDKVEIEIYHRAKFQGDEFDVVAYWPEREEGGFKECVAMVKLISDDLSTLSEDINANSAVGVDAAWNADSQADKFTLKNDKLVKNYWAPRWKYVVKALRTTMSKNYEKTGIYIPDPEPVVRPAEGETPGGGIVDPNSKEEVELIFQVFAGSTGKIIGPKGAKINEIRSGSGIKDITMPKKDEDAPRPRARDLVDITLKGTAFQIDKAKALIQAVVDEWANAPRPPRNNDNGGGGSGDFTSGGYDSGYGGGSGEGEAFPGGDSADPFGTGAADSNEGFATAGGDSWDTLATGTDAW